MTDLIAPADWPGIYQLEENDPVHGGVPDLASSEGFDNVPHLQLAQRTQFLRDAVEAIQAQLGGQAFATQADIDAAIAALLDGAPGALDTLKELADALAANGSAIGSINTALAARALAARLVQAGVGLTGGGDLTADRTLSVDFANLAASAAGTSTVLGMHPAGTKAAITAALDTRKYVSPWVTCPGPAASVTFIHGLTSPGTVQVDVRCNVATTGFEVGDILSMALSHRTGTYGIAVAVRGNNVIIHTAPSGMQLIAPNGDYAVIGAGNAQNFSIRTTAEET